MHSYPPSVAYADPGEELHLVAVAVVLIVPQVEHSSAAIVLKTHVLRAHAQLLTMCACCVVTMFSTV